MSVAWKRATIEGRSSDGDRSWLFSETAGVACSWEPPGREGISDARRAAVVAAGGVYSVFDRSGVTWDPATIDASAPFLITPTCRSAGVGISYSDPKLRPHDGQKRKSLADAPQPGHTL
jgi:hypothetical protein